MFKRFTSYDQEQTGIYVNMSDVYSISDNVTHRTFYIAKNGALAEVRVTNSFEECYGAMMYAYYKSQIESLREEYCKSRIR